MPLFEFNQGGGAFSSASTPSITFVDNGGTATPVTFTLTTTGSPGNQVTHSPGVNTGQVSISDFGAGVAPWTLDVVGGVSSGSFDGNGLVLKIGNSFSGTWNVTFIDGNTATPANVTLAITGSSQTISLGVISQHFSAIRFTPSGTGFLTIDSLNANIVCYLEGTGIATPTGRVAVQDLREGDMVLTADGRETPVRWLGVQPVDTRLMHPAKVNPIRITAGALGNGLPERDLSVSPDHAIAIDGMLINASALVNGTTIYQVAKMPLDGFTYYHIETEAHELLLAEGVAAESFVDYAGRDTFENGADSTAQITEMDMPRISSIRLVPDHIRAALMPAIAAE